MLVRRLVRWSARTSQRALQRGECCGPGCCRVSVASCRVQVVRLNYCAGDMCVVGAWGERALQPPRAGPCQHSRLYVDLYGICVGGGFKWGFKGDACVQSHAAPCGRGGACCCQQKPGACARACAADGALPPCRRGGGRRFRRLHHVTLSSPSLPGVAASRWHLTAAGGRSKKNPSEGGGAWPRATPPERHRRAPDKTSARRFARPLSASDCGPVEQQK